MTSSKTRFTFRFFEPASLRRSLKSVDWLAVGVCLAVLALDARTLAPSLLWSDEGEFQVQIASLGLPHQTGYPLYVLLGRLWLWLVPVGSVAYRVNALSAVFGSLTAGLVYLTIKRLAGDSLPSEPAKNQIEASRAATIVQLSSAAGLAAAAALAVSPAFWQQSSIAGVRSLHTAFVALITLLAVGLLQGRTWPEALGLALGLSFAHHRMTLLLLPGLTWIGWIWSARQIQTGRPVWRHWLRAGLLLTLPQLFYLYVWQRGQWLSLEDFLRFTLATNEVPIVLAKSQAEVVGQFTNQVLPSLARAFTPPGLLIAIGGIVALWATNGREATRSQRALSVYLGLGLVINVIFAGIHFTEDPNKYLTHGLTLLAIALGSGLAQLSAWLADRWRKVGAAAAALGLALPLVSGWFSFPAADQSRLDWIGPLTLDLITGIESDSLVVADWSYGWPMRYHQVVDDQRRDLTVLIRNETTLPQAEAALLAGQPVYVLKPAVVRAWKGVYPMIESPSGLVRVLPRPPEFGPPQGIHEDFGDGLALAGLATAPADLRSNQLVLVRLFWQTSGESAPRELALSVRLVSQSGDMWAQQDVRFSPPDPLDVAFLLQPGLPAGAYHWQVVVDDPATQQSLGQADLAAFEIGWPASLASPASIVVARRPQPPLQVGGWELLGGNPAAVQVKPGDPLLTPLFWRRLEAGALNQQPRLQLINQAGNVVAEAEIELPADKARPGDLVGVHTVLQTPDGLADGMYTLEVAGDGPSSSLGPLRVQGRPHVYRMPPAVQTRSARLGDRVELAGYKLDPAEVAPGQAAQLTLYWRALDDGVESYKVFVHVISASGQLLAQQDGLPAQWGIPSDTWVKREIIADEYSLDIPAQAAAGDYRVMVGMYREGGQRLPAVENGRRWENDSIELTPLQVAAE